jgi:hypothetical protein
VIDKDAENDVLAAFCHNGNVMACFMNSLLGAFATDAGRERRRLVEYHDACGPYIHDNRCRIAKYFLEHTDFQWLWMLDNDIEFEPDTLYKLLGAAEEHDLKVVGAAYWNRYNDKGSYLTWLRFTNEGIRACAALPEDPAPYPVTALGMGCTLIHRDALQDVADFHRAANPEDPWDTFGADLLKYDDGTAHRMGEDVTFCLRARRVGYEVFGIPTVLVGHYKPTFIPPRGMDALHDPRDAGGGANGAARHEVKPVPAP